MISMGKRKAFKELGKLSFGLKGKRKPLKYNSGAALNLFCGKKWDKAKVHTKKMRV